MGRSRVSDHGRIRRLTEGAVDKLLPETDLGLAVKCNLRAMQCAEEQVAVVERAVRVLDGLARGGTGSDQQYPRYRVGPAQVLENSHVSSQNTTLSALHRLVLQRSVPRQAVEACSGLLAAALSRRELGLATGRLCPNARGARASTAPFGLVQLVTRASARRPPRVSTAGTCLRSCL